MKKLIAGLLLLAVPIFAANTYTTRTGIPKPADHDLDWGVQVRGAFDIIDSSMCVQGRTNTFTSSNTFTGDVAIKNLGILTFYDSVGSAITGQIQTFPAGGITMSGNFGIQTDPISNIDISTTKFAIVSSSADASTAYSGFQATSPIDASTLWTLPTKDGTSGQSIITDGQGHLSFTGISGVSLPLPGGGTNYINVTSALQTGATFYVSSGTVQGKLCAYGDSSTWQYCINPNSSPPSITAIAAGGTTGRYQMLYGTNNVKAVDFGYGPAGSLNFIPNPSVQFFEAVSLSSGPLYFKQLASGSNYIKLVASNTVTTTQFVLPAADGTGGQAMVTDGAGNLSFSSIGGSLLPSTQTWTGGNTFTSTTTFVSTATFGNFVFSGTAYSPTESVPVLKVPSSPTGTFLGGYSGLSNTTGVSNTGIGHISLEFNTTGQYNTQVGESAGLFMGGDSNTGVGALTLFGSSSLSGSKVFGSSNTAIGFAAGGWDGVASTAVTSGSLNTYVGYRAGPGSASQLTNAGCIGANCLAMNSNSFRIGGTGANAVTVDMSTMTVSSASITNLNISGPVSPPTTFILKVSSSAGTTVFGVQNSGHFISSGTSISTATSCGTAPVISGTDNAMVLTGGTGSTGCTVTFGTPFATVPVCTVSQESMSVVNALSYTVSATAVTITQTGLGTNKLDIICIGNKG